MKAFDDLQASYPDLVPAIDSIRDACDLIVSSYINGGKVLTCGNGGSAADAEHIVGELLKSFEKKRPLSDEIITKIRSGCPELEGQFAEYLQMPLPAIALTAHLAFSTAFGNDVDPAFVFAQQLLGLGRAGDILIGLTTSGDSKNVVLATNLAKALGIKSIGLTGSGGGALLDICDICIRVPATRTYRVQEYHVAVYHAVCRAVEDSFFGDPGGSLS